MDDAEGDAIGTLLTVGVSIFFLYVGYISSKKEKMRKEDRDKYQEFEDSFLNVVTELPWGVRHLVMLLAFPLCFFLRGIYFPIAIYRKKVIEKRDVEQFRNEIQNELLCVQDCGDVINRLKTFEKHAIPDLANAMGVSSGEVAKIGKGQRSPTKSQKLHIKKYIERIFAKKYINSDGKVFPFTEANRPPTTAEIFSSKLPSR